MSDHFDSAGSLSDRVHEFIVASATGEVTNELRMEFEQLLRESDEACRLYLQGVDYSVLLPSVLAAIPDETSSDVLADSEKSQPAIHPAYVVFNGLSHAAANCLSSGWPAAYLIATVIFAMGLIVGSHTYISPPKEVAVQFDRGVASPDTKSASPMQARSQHIGRITGMVDCVWAPGADAIHPRSESRNLKSSVSFGDRFCIRSGFLEITYDSGAKVLLQGPVTYEAESATGGYLAIGKLTARVEKKTGTARSTPHSPFPSSPLFCVRTPTATITDLGTEFGVAVDENGRVETQVFEGVVRVVAKRDNGQLGASRDLHRGEIVFIDAKAVDIQPVASKPQPFVRKISRARDVNDSFSEVRDYLKNGVSGTVWHGLINAKNAVRLDTKPVTIDGVSFSGQLVLSVPKNAVVGWAERHRKHDFHNAPYLYVNVPKGDFEAQVRIGGQTRGHFSACGLMAHSDDNNFVTINRNLFEDRSFFGIRSEKDGVDSDSWSDPDNGNSGHVLAKMTRKGDVFFTACSIDDGKTWQALDWKNQGTLLHRSDMTGALRVGLWYGTFSDIDGTVAFDDFSIRLLEPASKAANAQ